MSLSRDHIALNALQWIDVSVSWEYAEPQFLAKQPRVLAEVKESGFGAVMLEVLPTQTLQAYRSVIDDSGLRVAPGYIQVGLPEDHGLDLRPGSADRFRWFDAVRRRAEESNFCGLDTVFLACEMRTQGGMPRIEKAAAVGADFDQARLDRVVELIGEAAQVLTAEGIRPALHNHVGSWIETQSEVEYVLDSIPESTLGAGFDIGHLVWAGGDPVGLVTKYRDRVAALHVKDIDVGIAEASRATPSPYFEVMAGRFFLELGLGGIPLKPTLDALPDTFDGWVIVEVDKPSMPPLESAKTSWAWVEQNVPA